MYMYVPGYINNRSAVTPAWDIRFATYSRTTCNNVIVLGDAIFNYSLTIYTKGSSSYWEIHLNDYIIKYNTR